jgi:CheY-like chemotaxis protein
MAIAVPLATKPQPTHWPPRGPASVLVVLDRPTMIELIKMTLNHGVRTIRTATSGNDVVIALSEWQSHLAILDMDLDGMQVIALRAS